jgi:hypothetical protein
MKKNIVIIAFFLQLVISCTSKSITKEEYVSKQTDMLLDSLNKCYEKVVIIPGTGCSGCISESEDFLKSNYSKKQILFILTNTKSIKVTSSRIGVNVKNLINVYIDLENRFSNYDKPIYPVVVSYDCNTKTINNILFQTPDSYVIKSL